MYIHECTIFILFFALSESITSWLGFSHYWNSLCISRIQSKVLWCHFLWNIYFAQRLKNTQSYLAETVLEVQLYFHSVNWKIFRYETIQPYEVQVFRASTINVHILNLSHIHYFSSDFSSVSIASDQSLWSTPYYPQRCPDILAQF
jgi:hypothetical protein